MRPTIALSEILTQLSGIGQDFSIEDLASASVALADPKADLKVRK